MIRKAYNLYKEIFGNKAQMIKAIEELAELQMAIAKFLNEPADKTNIIEEIADVEIMTEQLKIMFDCHREVEKVKVEKIDRMIKRVL